MVSNTVLSKNYYWSAAVPYFVQCLCECREEEECKGLCDHHGLPQAEAVGHPRGQLRQQLDVQGLEGNHGRKYRNT